MRIACIHVASFPLAAWWRAEPELRGAPLVVTDAPGPRAPIVACAPEVLQRGIAVGMTAAQAVAIASDLAVRPAAPAAEHAAQAALCDVAYSCSPRVEEGGMGTVYCDADGLTGWAEGPARENEKNLPATGHAAASSLKSSQRGLYASEAELARAIVTRARSLGLEASVGIAATKIAAQLAARDGGGCAVIPAHEEWHFLAPLPIQLLEPDAALRDTLARWGVRTLGDLAALPASAVATRLGPAGAALARRARGEDEHALTSRPLPLHFEETAELDYGVDSLEPFLFVLRGLLDRLIARLALRGLICGDLRLSLGLSGRGRDERIVAVAAPSNEIKPLLTLIRLHLEAHPPGDAVETVRIGAVPERLRPMQLDLFRPNGPAPAQLAAILARLAALCGADRLGAPVVADSHRPDAYGVGDFSQTSSVVRCPLSDSEQRTTDNGHRPIALRALRPPHRLEVFCDRGQPDFVRRAAPADGAYGCTGRVVTLAGPWRLQGEWWRADAYQRDYYDAQLSDGVVYRLFFDLAQQRWFADGVYD